MSYKYFENRSCEFYPCHDSETINCFFCFCPLYTMDCGGNFEMITSADGKLIKDCSKCLIPHSENGYEWVIEKLKLMNTNENRGGNDESKI